MKKLLLLATSLVLTLALGLGLASCTRQADVAVFIYKFADPYIASVRDKIAKGLKQIKIEDVDKEGKKYTRKLTYQIYDANEKQDVQNSQIDTAISNGAKMLVVNIVEVKSADQVVEKAKSAKIPVLFFNREIGDAPLFSYEESSFIGTDPNEAGVKQGQLAFSFLDTEEKFKAADKNGDGKINYFMMRASLDNPEANGRTEYSVKTLKQLLKDKYGDKYQLVQVGSDTNAEWDSTNAKSKFDSALQSYRFGTDKAIELVFANNDGMAEGVKAALDAVGYNKPDSKDDKRILIFGVDALPSTVNFINKNKQITATVGQDAVKMSDAIVKFVKNVLVDGNAKEMNKGTGYEYTLSLEEKNEGKMVKKVRIPYILVK